MPASTLCHGTRLRASRTLYWPPRRRHARNAETILALPDLGGGHESEFDLDVGAMTIGQRLRSKGFVVNLKAEPGLVYCGSPAVDSVTQALPEAARQGLPSQSSGRGA